MSCLKTGFPVGCVLLFNCGNQAQGNRTSLKALYQESNVHLLFWNNKWWNGSKVKTKQNKTNCTVQCIFFFVFSYEIPSGHRSYPRKLDKSCISYNILVKAIIHIVRSSSEEIQLHRNGAVWTHGDFLSHSLNLILFFA